MTLNDGFDRTVSEWLHEEAGRGAPGYLDEVLVRTTRTRQRPAWSSLERWLPVQTTLRLVPVPRLAWLLVIVGLIAALGAAVLLVGSRSRLPAPFGPAANGSIVYGTDGGDILVYDPATGVSSPIIAGTTNDETPDFSPDGTKILFARETEVTDRWLLLVADADGSDGRPLTGPIYPSWNVWSPDSTRVAVVDTAPPIDTLSIVGLDGGPSQSLPLDGMTPDRVQWRSPTELVFLGVRFSSRGLYSISTDGSQPRAILPATFVDTDWMDPVLSPDSSKIAYTRWVGEGPVIHVLDIATGATVAPPFGGSSGWPTWSPDGTKLLFNWWTGTENRLAIGSVDGGPVVEIGPGFADFTGGAVGVFSPDGTKIVARYGFDPAATWFLDPTGGPGERVLTGVSGVVSWQRVAP